MRDIKFRAWDKENKQMIDIARFDFADYTVYSHLFACEGYLGENLKTCNTLDCRTSTVKRFMRAMY